MELDKLCEDLKRWAELTDSKVVADTLRKAAEVIKLQRECICEESNERWRRGIDALAAEGKGNDGGV